MSSESDLTNSEAVRLVLTTFGHPEDAARVVRQLVEEKLAACGTLLPGARSIYQWQGVIEDNKETVVQLKTTVSRLNVLTARLAELHSYEVPEIVVIEPASVSESYANWVRDWVGNS